MLKDKENLKATLEKFKKYVIKESRKNLTRKGKNVSRNLYNSINANYVVHANSFSFEFEMTDYGQFVDQGVRGKRSSERAPKSPFKFGSGKGNKGGLTQGIKKWVRAKRIQFSHKKTDKLSNKKKGQFMSYEQTGFLITRSIYNKGMKPSLFFTKPFENGFKRLPDEMVKAFALDVEQFYDFTL